MFMQDFCCIKVFSENKEVRKNITDIMYNMAKEHRLQIALTLPCTVSGYVRVELQI
jgi:hypothetical protein